MPKSVLDDFDDDLFAGRARPSEAVATPAEPYPGESVAPKDVERIYSLKDRFSAAAKAHAVPEEVLEGIASRESRVGMGLDATGFGGKNKRMYGIMQVNADAHSLRGTDAPDSAEHIDQSAEILQEYKGLMDKKFPKLSGDKKWQAAVAAYNAGPASIKTEDVDRYTDGHDYSGDVMARARVFREKFKKQRAKK